MRTILGIMSAGAEEEDRPAAVGAEDGAHAVVLLEHPGEGVVGVVLDPAEVAAEGADEVAAERLAGDAAQGAAEERLVHVVRQVDLGKLSGRLGGTASGLAQQSAQQSAVLIHDGAEEETGAMG